MFELSIFLQSYKIFLQDLFVKHWVFIHFTTKLPMYQQCINNHIAFKIPTSHILIMQYVKHMYRFIKHFLFDIHLLQYKQKMKSICDICFHRNKAISTISCDDVANYQYPVHSNQRRSALAVHLNVSNIEQC